VWRDLRKEDLLADVVLRYYWFLSQGTRANQTDPVMEIATDKNHKSRQLTMSMFLRKSLFRMIIGSKEVSLARFGIISEAPPQSLRIKIKI